MTFNGKRTPRCKPYNNRPIEALTIYGEGSKIIPDHGKGCQFKVDDLFCNAPPNDKKVYCETHAGICGWIYGGKKSE